MSWYNKQKVKGSHRSLEKIFLPINKLDQSYHCIKHFCSTDFFFKFNHFTIIRFSFSLVSDESGIWNPLQPKMYYTCQGWKYPVVLRKITNISDNERQCTKTWSKLKAHLSIWLRLVQMRYWRKFFKIYENMNI